MPTAREDVALSLRRTHPRQARAAGGGRGGAGRASAWRASATRSVHGLSGGERQLLALAGVLATGPTVLVADEPTTLLDLGNSRRIGELLLGLPQQLVLVTHDLELASRCDRALLVRHGRVEHDGAGRGRRARTTGRRRERRPPRDPPSRRHVRCTGARPAPSCSASLVASVVVVLVRGPASRGGGRSSWRPGCWCGPGARLDVTLRAMRGTAADGRPAGALDRLAGRVAARRSRSSATWSPWSCSPPRSRSPPRSTR